jgi:hypothetical protein
MNRNIILSEEQSLLINRLLKGKGISFVTGRAGTGKTTLIMHFINHYKKNLVVLAPTGVAALNVCGVTIHKFFHFPFNLDDEKFNKLGFTQPEYKNLDCLVIDEISMVRCDMLDYINLFLQRAKKSNKPFGGVQIIMVGDLYQLPPIVDYREKQYFKEAYDTEYFFSSKVLKENHFAIYELSNIYRQKDLEFISILNAIRNGTVENNHLQRLNECIGKNINNNDRNIYVTLCSLRKVATEINAQKLNEIQEKEYVFDAIVSGNISRDDYPAEERLVLKENAQVMLLKNDIDGQWYNGSLGTIVGFYDLDDNEVGFNHQDLIIRVRLEDGTLVDVPKVTWDIDEILYDKQNKKLKYQTIGTFKQYPISLSWALSIHKSQGKTFKYVSINIKGGLFATGQLYVGISRCTTLDGLSLEREIEEKHIKFDWRVSKFFTDYYVQESEKLLGYETKRAIVTTCIAKEIELEIKYLNKNNELSIRRIKPLRFYLREYKNTEFWALEAYCYKRQENRHFQIARILNILNLEKMMSQIEENMNVPKPQMTKENIYCVKKYDKMAYKHVFLAKRADKSDFPVFEHGLARIKDTTTNKRGFINEKYEIVIPCIYDGVYSFNEDSDFVVATINKKSGIINVKGEEIVPFIYDGAINICEESAAIAINDKWAIIDKISGKQIVPFIYDDIGGRHSPKDKWSFVERNKKKGVINTVTGELLVPCEYDELVGDINGYFHVAINGKKGFIDKNGKYNIPCIYDDSQKFCEGFAAVKLNDQWGYIDNMGKVIIPCKYEKVGWFSNGLATVKESGKWGVINNKGEKIINCEYEELGCYSEDDDIFRTFFACIKVKQNGKWGFIDKTGTIISPCQYGFIPPDYDIRKSFEYLYPNLQYSILDLSKLLIRVEKDNKWGYMNHKGKEVIICKYDLIRETIFLDRFVRVKLNNKWGVIDKNGKEIIPFICEHERDIEIVIQKISYGNL